MTPFRHATALPLQGAGPDCPSDFRLFRGCVTSVRQRSNCGTRCRVTGQRGVSDDRQARAQDREDYATVHHSAQRHDAAPQARTARKQVPPCPGHFSMPRNLATLPDTAPLASRWHPAAPPFTHLNKGRTNITPPRTLQSRGSAGMQGASGVSSYGRARAMAEPVPTLPRSVRVAWGVPWGVPVGTGAGPSRALRAGRCGCMPSQTTAARPFTALMEPR
jgi:hypothetical protein